jgi:hypothetical protein
VKTLPNGVLVFNATPHPINFWKEGWESVVTVGVDTVINASPSEEPVTSGAWDARNFSANIQFVKTAFAGTGEGRAVAEKARAQGAVVVGSIIAAQAYPGLVCAMTPAPGYERVAPAEKRMNPDKFTVF